MTGARASFMRPTIAILLALCGVLSLMAVGCGDDDETNPTFPDPIELEAKTWFLGVWGTGPDDVYVVGQPGLIFHWNGAAWSQQESGTSVALTDVWGDGAGTVYVTGHDGVILRRQGGSWSAMTSGTDADLFSVGAFHGQIYACGRNDSLAVLRRLDGGSWGPAGREIYQRDTEAVTDTLYLDTNEDPEEIVESLTAVGHLGITGSDGIILMEDPEADWRLRRVRGGAEWVTCIAGTERINSNFIATDHGRLFRLTEVEGVVSGWAERFSPSLDNTIYGLYVDDADTVWTVTVNGRVLRTDPPLHNSVNVMYDDGQILFDVWGSSSSNLYAVGIEGRVLRFVNDGVDLYWVEEELPLPETKHHAQPVFDKFGRPIR